MDDNVMIDYWNGRPSVWLSSSVDQPFLHWMILGHTEDFELWLHARLSWPTAEELAEHPPRMLDDALRLIAGAEVRFVLEDARRPVLIADVVLPHEGANLAEALRPMVEAMQQKLLDRGLDQLLIEAAAHDVARLTAA